MVKKQFNVTHKSCSNINNSRYQELDNIDKRNADSMSKFSVAIK